MTRGRGIRCAARLFLAAEVADQKEVGHDLRLDGKASIDGNLDMSASMHTNHCPIVAQFSTIHEKC